MEIPREFRCVLTNLIMYDPVNNGNGEIYEREAIEDWLKINRTSPKTNKTLENVNSFTPDRLLKMKIDLFLKQYPEFQSKVYFPKTIQKEFIDVVKNNNLIRLQELLQSVPRFFEHRFQEERNNTLLHLVFYYGTVEMFNLVIKMMEEYKLGLSDVILWLPNQEGWFPFYYGILLKRPGFVGRFSELKILNQELIISQEKSIEPSNYILIQRHLDSLLYLCAANRRNDHTSRTIEQNDSTIEREMEFLIRLSASINTRQDEGKTPLAIASLLGNRKAIEVLLKHGADLGDRINPTPLMNASLKGHKDIVEMLLSHGANPDIQNNFGQNALMFAIQENHIEIVKLLINTGNSGINKKDSRLGRTPLMLAIERNNQEIISILISNGSNIDEADKNGNTALMYAAKQNFRGSIELLLQNRANYSLVNREGKYANILGNSDTNEFINRRIFQLSTERILQFNACLVEMREMREEIKQLKEKLLQLEIADQHRKCQDK